MTSTHVDIDAAPWSAGTAFCGPDAIYTVTFQAPGFYERHGYRRFGEIVCLPSAPTGSF